VRIALVAEACGVQALAVHGRTRADLYQGEAEYATISAVKAAVRIPVVANGDIDSPAKARHVLQVTGADAVMIGRAALGRPWIFREVDQFLRTGTPSKAPDLGEIRHIMESHLGALHAFYGDVLGARVARKHVAWYAQSLPRGEALRAAVNHLSDPRAQLDAVARFFEQLDAVGDQRDRCAGQRMAA
jgi:tRNA-dihydrouridine synthase B